MPTYKWGSAYEWFEQYVNRLISERKINEVVAMLLEFAQKAGNDEIQDLCQSVMREDGFFQKEYSLEEFTAALDTAIREMESYKEDLQTDDNVNSPTDWLQVAWGESYESLYKDHDGDVENVIAYLE